MNKFLKDLMVLAEELSNAEGFHALVIVSEMELLYEKHVNELKNSRIINNISSSIPNLEATMVKYGAIPTDWKHFFDDLNSNK